MVLPDRACDDREDESASEDERRPTANRRRVLAGLLGMTVGMTLDTTLAFTVRTAEAQTATSHGAYVSPYGLRLTSDTGLLNAGFDQRPWNEPADEAEQPIAAWEAAHARRPAGDWPQEAAWGPPAAQYPRPALPRTDAAYLRERVIAVAAR